MKKVCLKELRAKTIFCLVLLTIFALGALFSLPNTFAEEGTPAITEFVDNCEGINPLGQRVSSYGLRVHWDNVQTVGDTARFTHNNDTGKTSYADYDLLDGQNAVEIIMYEKVEQDGSRPEGLKYPHIFWWDVGGKDAVWREYDNNIRIDVMQMGVPEGADTPERYSMLRWTSRVADGATKVRVYMPDNGEDMTKLQIGRIRLYNYGNPESAYEIYDVYDCIGYPAGNALLDFKDVMTGAGYCYQLSSTSYFVYNMEGYSNLEIYAEEEIASGHGLHDIERLSFDYKTGDNEQFLELPESALKTHFIRGNSGTPKRLHDYFYYIEAPEGTTAIRVNFGNNENASQHKYHSIRHIKRWTPDKRYETSDFTIGNFVTIPNVGGIINGTTIKDQYTFISLYEAMADSGINLNIVNSTSSDRLEYIHRVLAAANYTDTNIIIHDETLLDALEDGNQSAATEAIATYKDDPAFAGHFIFDEPQYIHFEKLGEMKSVYDIVCPNKIFFINLLPNEVNARVLYGEKEPTGYNYDQYIKDYLTIIGGEFVMYDHYPLLLNSGDGKTTTTALFLKNLELAAKNAKAEGIPFYTFLQSVQWQYTEYDGYDTKRAPNSEADTAWQAYSAMAYGVSGINWFTYLTPTNDFEKAMIDNDLLPTETYYHVSAINNKIHKFADIYLNYDWQGVMTSGESAAFELIDTLSETAGILDWSSEAEALLGVFSKDGRQGYMLVNYTDPALMQSNPVSLQMPGSKVEIYRDGKKQEVSLTDGMLELVLNAGEGVFIELPSSFVEKPVISLDSQDKAQGTITINLPANQTDNLRVAITEEGGNISELTWVDPQQSDTEYTYTFEGLEEGKVYQIYAKWEATSDNYESEISDVLTIDMSYEYRVVTFNVNAANIQNTPLPQTIIVGSKAESPKDSPARVGYTFLGWHRSDDEGITLSAQAFDFDTTITDNITLYAKWEINTYGITYVNTGDAENLNPAEYTYGQEVVLQTPVKNGYLFLGWYTNASMAENSYVTKIEAGTTGAVTLYAKFEIIQVPDKAALNTVIATAEGKVESQYTSESWQNFTQKLNAAKTVAANEDATQAEIDDAKSDLDSAINSLVLSDDGAGTTTPEPDPKGCKSAIMYGTLSIFVALFVLAAIFILAKKITSSRK